jgi:FkbM family methyltransferase
MLRKIKLSLFERFRYATKLQAIRRLATELSVLDHEGVDLETLQVIASIKSYINCKGLVLVDVGAHKGLFAKPAMQALGFSRFLAYEPNPALHTLIKNNTKGMSGEIRGKGLAETSGTFELQIHPDPSMSSFLNSNRDVLKREFSYYDPDSVRSLAVEVSTLDCELFPGNEKPQRFFLKIDTQGNELSVLKGGRKSLSLCEGMLVEHMFVTPYQDQAMFAELINFLQSQRFHCVGVLAMNRKPTHRITGVDFLCLPESNANKAMKS